MRRLISLPAALAVSLALAACGGSSSPSAQVTVTRTVTTPVSTTSTAPATTSTQTSSTSQTTPAVAACIASDLQLISEGTNGAAGTVVATFAMRNVGSSPCHTYGWPGVLFLDKSGAPLTTDAMRTTHDVLGATPAAPIVIEPGALASFRIVASIVGSGANCTTAYGLQAIAPDDTATMHTAISNGGVTECQKVTVSPLALGSGLYPGT